MSWTLFFWNITGSIARAKTSRHAHVSDGSRIVHGSRRCTRYAWPERRCRESRRGVGETTASARSASDLTRLQAGLARPRVSDHDELRCSLNNAGSSKVKPARRTTRRVEGVLPGLGSGRGGCMECGECAGSAQDAMTGVRLLPLAADRQGGSGPGNPGRANAFLRRAGASRWRWMSVCVDELACCDFGPRHTAQLPHVRLLPIVASGSEALGRKAGTGEPQVHMPFADPEHSDQPRSHCASPAARQIPNNSAVIHPSSTLGDTIRHTRANHCSNNHKRTRQNMAAQESNSNGLSASTTNPANILTYHCLCTQLSLATTIPLESLPKRQLDGAAIATNGDFASALKPTLTMQALSVDDSATILKLDDGFEKRYAVRCTRCGLAAGYQLDKSQFGGTESQIGPRTDVVYILPGGLLTTEEMREGRSMEAEVGKVGMVAT
jgi:hypothetical protein